MSTYSKILVPVDLSGESAQIVRKAFDVGCSEPEVHLMYVLEPMDSVYLGVVPYGPVFVGMDQVEHRLEDELKNKLSVLGDAHGVPADRQHFISGTPAREIHRLADDGEFDLVVMGTHGQKGVQLLLGSTANAVLHGAKCDVLAVRVTDTDSD